MSTLLLLFTGILATANAGCSPFMIESADGKMCYMMYEGALSFDQAMEMCQEEQGTLAAIHDRTQNEKLLGQFDNDYFIGGTQLGKKWTWTDGSAFSYTHWAAGQPRKGGNKRCVKVDSVTGLWSNVDCSITLPFLCQLPSIPGDPMTTWAPSHTDCPTASVCHKGMVYTIPDPYFSTWNDAQQYCKAKFNGQLASIHDDDLEKQLHYLSYESGSNTAYIGGRIENGKFVWSDGTPVDYTHWVDMYTPNYSDSQLTCLMFSADMGDSTTGWYFETCTTQMQDTTNALCEYPMKKN
ncbi:hypothetical protein L596_026184 [Steinernema carpocapsae]|uniref:C-type lectin domain-containing protein n=1 Tax=Steinernema carpocapsae TaxID=34508 RepID=A0A4U5M0Q0_STECR|nr:hypothetical protein L596_026184 [Steinernema carpocapsae]